MINEGYKINKRNGNKIFIRPTEEWQRRPIELRFTDNEVHVYGFTFPYRHGHLIHDVVKNYESIEERYELLFFNAVSYLVSMADIYAVAAPSEPLIPKPEYEFLSDKAVHLVWDREERNLRIIFTEEESSFKGVSKDGVAISGIITRSTDELSALCRWIKEGC